MTCFNVTPEFAVSFKFQKSKGKGEFCIKYMEAAFDKEMGSGEFFLEFVEKVREHKLAQSFQAQGAGQVTTITFAHNDGESSASDALLRVLATQEATNIKYARGSRPQGLVDKLKEIQTAAAAVKEKTVDQEFNEKYAAALALSVKDVTTNVKVVKEEVQSQGVKLQALGNDMQSQNVKLETQAVNIVDIKQGVCSVIPELQERIKQLEKEVEYHKTQRDSQEGKTAVQTGRVNKLKEVVAAKDVELSALHKREEGLLGRIKELEATLQVCKAIEQLRDMTHLAQEERVFARTERAELKQSIAEIQESAKSLGVVLAQEEERAAKRQRV